MVTIKQRAAVNRMAHCRHQPPCPPASGSDRLAAVVIAAHPEQGWNLLCNGVIVFEDTGAIAAGQAIPPRRAAACGPRPASGYAAA
jgi:Family of unknown function (DUF5999)